MSQPVRLSIPTPCHENWENFAPTSTGGFCSSCSKNVIDFTKMTDAEVIDFIKTKPTNACGRFRKNQLKEYPTTASHDFKIMPSGMLLRAGIISLFLAMISKPTIAQTSEQTPRTEQSIARKLNLPDDKSRMISGIVTDNAGYALPGVTILLVGSTEITVTDSLGKFLFPKPVNDGQMLTFSFIGYGTYMHYVGFSNDDFLEVKLTPYLPQLQGVVGGLVLTGEILTKDTDVPKKNLFATIKSWFR